MDDRGTRRSTSALLILTAALGWSLAQPRVARAQDDIRAENGMVWGVASFELAAPLTLAAVAAWDPDAFQSSRYALYMAPPIAVALGIGLLGYSQEWDAAIPRTTHGVLWGAAEGLLVGALIDGLARDSGLGIGPWAYGLAGVGALAGGWLGATEIEPGTPTQGWFTGPWVGAAAGAGIAAVPTLLLALNGHDRAAGQVFGWTTVAGIATGFLFALASEPDTATDTTVTRRVATLMLSMPVRF
jgi:hypothetical protein